MLNIIDDYPLKNITTLQIGGPAKKFVVVKTEAELVEAIGYAKSQSLSYLVIGGGSNLLVADEGVACLVIKNEITSIETSEVEKETSEVKVASGTLLQDLVDYAINHGLAGLEKLTGIPGTVGGAIYGNAGAYGETISDYLTDVVILESEATPESVDSGQVLRSRGTQDRGARVTLSKEECKFNYRDSIFKKNHDVILEVAFQLKPVDPKTLAEKAQEVLSKRLVKYPPGIKCPGSFFKNIVASTIPKAILDKIPPEKIVYGKLPAGALLESVGAKGQKSDGVEIASYHANLFINQGSGSAQAFYDLAKTYALKVKEKYGITLEPEVQLVNLLPL